MKLIKEYQKLHNTITDYNDWTNSDAYITPNISVIEGEINTGRNGIKYNELVHNYKKDYFTIESLEDNNEISLYALQANYNSTLVYWSLNGQDWNEVQYTEGSNRIITTLQANLKLYIKSSVETFGNRFISTKDFKVYGNILSLSLGDNFINLTGHGTFTLLFSGCSELIDAENLILPQGSFYNEMFMNCSSLTTSPRINIDYPNAYSGMFIGCSSLNHILCPLKQGMSIQYWASYVPSEGTFVKNALAIWTRGTSGIPENWRVEFYGFNSNNYLEGNKLYLESTFSYLTDDEFLAQYNGYELYVDGTYIGIIENKSSEYYYY